MGLAGLQDFYFCPQIFADSISEYLREKKIF